MARRGAGFTLLEVLIAITIFATTISIVYGLYGAVMSTVTAVEDRIDRNGRVQVAFARLGRDLGGLYRGDAGYLKGLDSTGNPFAEDPFLEFASTAHLSFDPAADPVPLSVIRYYLVAGEEEEETFVLLRSDTPFPLAADDEEFVPEVSEGRRLPVCEGLLEVRVSYLDRDGDEQTEWDTREGFSEEELTDDGRFPARVVIEFVFPAGADAAEEGEVYSTAALPRPGVYQFGEGSGG